MSIKMPWVPMIFPSGPEHRGFHHMQILFASVRVNPLFLQFDALAGLHDQGMVVVGRRRQVIDLSQAEWQCLSLLSPRAPL